MKDSKKTALCGIIAALSVLVMLLSYFPYFTYAVPALAGAFMIVPTVQISKKWAIFTYIASGIISLIICEKEASVLYVCFFGYYLIFKAFIEGKRYKRIIEIIVKQAVFSVAVTVAYIVIIYVFGIPFAESKYAGTLFTVLFLIAGNIVFYIYDIGLSRIISLYFYTLHNKIEKMLK